MKKTTLALALCCSLNFSFAYASPQAWQKLSPSEQEALAPLHAQWDSLPEHQQHHMLGIAQHYPGLNSDAKQRFLSRLSTWAKLTPEQRQAARDKYRAFSKVPADKREQVKQMIRQNEEAKMQQPDHVVAPK